MRPADRTSRPRESAPVERRDLRSRNALVHRIRREFDQMPGLILTCPQACRLFGVAPDAMARIFSQLVAEGALTAYPDGRHRQRSSS